MEQVESVIVLHYALKLVLSILPEVGHKTSEVVGVSIFMSVPSSTLEREIAENSVIDQFVVSWLLTSMTE
jgi:hypothetical protein